MRRSIINRTVKYNKNINNMSLFSIYNFCTKLSRPYHIADRNLKFTKNEYRVAYYIALKFNHYFNYKKYLFKYIKKYKEGSRNFFIDNIQKYETLIFFSKLFNLKYSKVNVTKSIIFNRSDLYICYFNDKLPEKINPSISCTLSRLRKKCVMDNIKLMNNMNDIVWKESIIYENKNLKKIYHDNIKNNHVYEWVLSMDYFKIVFDDN